MLEITSTPLVIMAILGTVGVLLPIISIARKEQGSNSFYAIIAFSALIVSMGYVGYQFLEACQYYREYAEKKSNKRWTFVQFNFFRFIAGISDPPCFT